MNLSLPIGPGSFRRRTPHDGVMDARIAPGAGSSRSKAPEIAWTAEEDALLKRFADKYPYNWILIADALNVAKVTIPIERRSPWDCQERWKSKFGPSANAEEDIKPPPTPTTSMTTRGTKRSLSTSVNLSGGSGGGSAQGDSRKRRRHNIMADAIRKVVKKRDQAQRTNGMSSMSFALVSVYELWLLIQL
jgi:chromatin modification-related protein VID21